MNKPKGVKKKFNTIDSVYMALGAVIIAICSWIRIPSPVPFTMQTFAVFFVLSALGGKRGTLATTVYVLLSAVGSSIFVQISLLTEGYVVGFIFMGLIYWFIVGALGKKLWIETLAMTIGLIVLYTSGTIWFMIAYTQMNESIGLATALALCVIPFIVPDLIKMGLALILAKRLSPVLHYTVSKT